MLSGTSLPTLTALPARLRRAVLRHRRLLAFALIALAVGATLHVVRPAPAATGALAVAARDLPAGTTLTTADLAVERVPLGDVPDGAGAHLGGVLAAPVRRGEPITDLRLVGPGLAELAGDPSLTAVPVRFSDADMAGLLHVGDRIELLATSPSDGSTRLVAARADVLATPQQNLSGTGVTNAESGRLVIVGVTGDLVTAVTSAAVEGFLTYAYGH